MKYRNLRRNQIFQYFSLRFMAFRNVKVFSVKDPNTLKQKDQSNIGITDYLSLTGSSHAAIKVTLTQ